MVVHGAMHPMQFRAALFVILERQRLQWLPINSISPLNNSSFFSFSISREAKFAVHLKRLPGSLRFRLLIFNVFHFCVFTMFVVNSQRLPNMPRSLLFHLLLCTSCFSTFTFYHVCSNFICVDPFHPTYSTESFHRVNRALALQ